jgi:hypothetical protein
MTNVDPVADGLRPEYHAEDFGPMVRGKYAARMRESSNVVVLDPDVAEAFPNAQAVNRALRGLQPLPSPDPFPALKREGRGDAAAALPPSPLGKGD